MNPRAPPPLRGSEGPPLEARAGRLLEAADVVEPWPAEERQETWRGIALRAGPSPRWGLWVGIATTAVLLVTGLLLLRHGLPAEDPPLPVAAVAVAPPALRPPPALRHIDLGSIGTIDVSEEAVVATKGSTVQLDSGRLCAVIRHRDVREGPFTVVAPKLRVVDLGTRFCVDVTSEQTSVEVTEGEVRVEGESWSTKVGAGGSMSSNEPRFRTPVPTVAAPPVETPSRCEALSALAEREACEAAASSGEGLAAQNALYNLALQARDQRHDGASALSLFQAYRHRFPKGPLAPEASVGILTELSSEGRYSDAAAEAKDYLKSYPGEARTPQVGLILGNLERERLNDASAARAAYEQVLGSGAEPDVAGEALFGLALSELQLGQKTDAQAAARRYLAEHPSGARAGEAQRLLERRE